VKFFFDNQLSPRLAQAIGALSAAEGHEVVHLRDRFASSERDEVWIPALAAEGQWILVCGDLNIVRTKAQRPIWRASRLVGFFLKPGWMNQGPWEQAWRLVRWWPVVVRQAALAAPGSTYGLAVNPSSKVETLL
jgi:hypothetical protein